jgi:integrase
MSKPRTTARRKLSAAFINALKTPPGTRQVFYDTDPPCFALRTSGTAKSYIIYVRLPGCKAPTRLALGDASKLSLAAARAKAREWLNLIEQGKDPRIVAQQALLAQQRAQRTTFIAVAEDFIADKLPSERNGKRVECDIRRDLLPLWSGKPITEISDLDVLALVRAKKATPAQARSLLGLAKRLFGWAIDQRSYGLTINPCANLRASKLVGEKAHSDRVLTDDEIFALWRCSGRIGYPYGAIYRLLLLTGLRLNEVADARWTELDIAKREWTIPAARMKGRTGHARPHMVPLTDDIMDIVGNLPRFTRGNFLFSSTSGASSVWMSSQLKARVDVRLRRTLRALARSRGDDLMGREILPAWKNHDIRRSVRTQLSRLKIPEEVREAVLAHVRPGIAKVYDLHDYADEKREALRLWAARLHGIIAPQSANVVSLRPSKGA